MPVKNSLDSYFMELIVPSLNEQLNNDVLMFQKRCNMTIHILILLFFLIVYKNFYWFKIFILTLYR